jgi:transcriptional regulator GlxA family with amidase domain
VRESLRSEYLLSDERVVEDGRLVTSQGPGTSFEFALALVARLCGSDTADEVSAPMVLP